MIKISPVHHALLLCARHSLSPHQADRLVEVVSGEMDWRTLIEGASANLILPLVARHVLPLLQSDGNQEFKASLTRARNTAIKRMLHVCAVKREVVSKVLEPRSIAYFELKGSVLSAELYGNNFIRQFRDIDLLIEPARIEEAAQALVELDWRVINKEWDGDARRDLSVLSQYQAAIELYSPNGVVLELHRRLDNSGCVFSTRNIFCNRRGCSMGVELPRDLHFVYMLFHHSRHRWESLHWIADAQMFSQIPQDEIMAVKRAAKRFGLLTTVDETLRLVDNINQLTDEGLPSNARKSRFLEDFLTAFNFSFPNSTREFTQLDAEDRHPDFAYAWQKTRWYRIKFALSRFRPSLNDFDWLPLRGGLRWVYWLSKPWRVLLQNYKGWRHS